MNDLLNHLGGSTTVLAVLADAASLAFVLVACAVFDRHNKRDRPAEPARRSRAS
jgi:hypothetical protein